MKISREGKESRIEIAYIRGSQVNFIVLPDMLQCAPFFNRIKMWRKFKGHAVYGANTAAVNAIGGRGFPRGPGGPGRGGPGRGGPSPYGPGPSGGPGPGPGYRPVGAPQPSYYGGR